jgi:hypothetical protein
MNGTAGSMSVAERVNLTAAERANPAFRVSTITVDLGRLTSGEQTTVLGLEIGDAIAAELALGTGSPDTIRQTRRIDGIAHSVVDRGNHSVTFTLGAVATVDFTITLKQNASSVACTTNEAVYWATDGWVTAHISLEATAAGTTNTEIKITPSGLPSPSTANAGKCVGTFSFVDGTAGNYTGFVDWDGTDLKFYIHSAAGVTPLGQQPNFAIASGDDMALTIVYRAAG